MPGAPSIGDEPVLVNEELHDEIKANLHKRKGLPAYIPAYEERRQARKAQKTFTPSPSKEPCLRQVPVDDELEGFRMTPSLDQRGLIVRDLMTSRRKLEHDNQHLRQELDNAKTLIRELRQKIKENDGHATSSMPLFSIGRKIGNSLSRSRKHRRTKPLMFGGKTKGPYHNPVESSWFKFFEAAPETPKLPRNNNLDSHPQVVAGMQQVVRQVFLDIDGAPPPPVLDVEVCRPSRRRRLQIEGLSEGELANRLAKSVTLGSSDCSTTTTTSSLSEDEAPKKTPRGRE